MFQFEDNFLKLSYNYLKLFPYKRKSIQNQNIFQDNFQDKIKFEYEMRIMLFQ